jgi:hypothetical protein
MTQPADCTCPTTPLLSTGHLPDCPASKIRYVEIIRWWDGTQRVLLRYPQPKRGLVLYSGLLEDSAKLAKHIDNWLAEWLEADAK